MTWSKAFITAVAVTLGLLGFSLASEGIARALGDHPLEEVEHHDDDGDHGDDKDHSDDMSEEDASHE